MKPANPLVLTINGGSSSIKFALYPVEEPLKRVLYGKVDRIGLSGTNLTFNDPNKKQPESLDLAAADRERHRRLRDHSSPRAVGGRARQGEGGSGWG